MPPKPKTSVSEMLELFKLVVNENEDEEKILVTTNRMVYHYSDKMNVELSRPTLRNYGFCPGGHFVSKYPGVFEYNDSGKRTYRGMVIDVENFKDEIGVELND